MVTAFVQFKVSERMNRERAKEVFSELHRLTRAIIND
jgi:hypothetical protein